MSRFDEIYQKLIRAILLGGVTELSERTRHETRTVPGLHFSTDLEEDGFPLVTLRRVPIRVFVAEQVWFIRGARKPDDLLRQYTRIWDNFTNPQDVVTVAYGYRWRRHFGRDQLALALRLLKREPSSRQALVVTWDPAQDGLSLFKKKNVPCPYAFTLNIIGGRLHLHNIVRSNDMILGFPHDVAGFALLQMIIAQRLGVRAGIYSHSISNAHIYDVHYFAAEELTRRSSLNQRIDFTLPPRTFERVEKRDPLITDEVIAALDCNYQPLEPIKGLELVL